MLPGQDGKVYRNPALLKLAARATRCMNPWCECGPIEPGSIMPCHSNLQRHGKGKGLKAHDLTAFLGPVCHDLLDGRRKGWDPEKCELVFLEASWWTTLYLLRQDCLVVNPKGGA
jgi:hypothetical protein